ncbi:MAG: hypothetical protein ACLTDR_00025 [Adlercreutzia equolifaciens]
MGPVRKKALLKHFKSFKNLKAATLEEIKEARVVPSRWPRSWCRVLQQYNERKKRRKNSWQKTLLGKGGPCEPRR